MPTTSPLAFSSGSPAAALGAAGEELMEGMPPAGPLAMAVATPVTAPGVQCSATEAPCRGDEAERQVGRPAAEGGVVGERCHREVLGHGHQRHVGRLVRGRRRWPARACRRARPSTIVCAPAQEVGGRGDQSSLGHGDADRAPRSPARSWPGAPPWSVRPPGPRRAPRSAARPGSWARRRRCHGCVLERLRRRRGEQHDDPGDRRP